MAYKIAGIKRGFSHPSDSLGLLQWPWTSWGCISPWCPSPGLMLTPTNGPMFQPFWPSPVPREVPDAQGWGCPLPLPVCAAPGWGGGIGPALTPPGSPRSQGTPPAPQHPDTGRLSFPILLPCCRISTLNANTSTCLPNLLLETVLMPGTTRLPCKREIPKRMEKGIFHFEMEFCFDNFISLMLRYCRILEYLDCRIIAVSNKSNKNVSCAYVVANVTQGP